MHFRLPAHLQRLASGLHDPLSDAMLPLINGLLRQLMLRSGAQMMQRQLLGSSVNIYHAPGRRVAGENIPVLLVHGIADNAVTWALDMPLLRRVGDVYAIDLPGFGLSSAPAGRDGATFDELRDVLRAMIAEVIGRPALVVGNSLGGWLAVRLAWAAPELVRGIVLIDAGGAPLGGYESWQPFKDTVAVRDLRAVRLIYRQMFGRVPLPLYLGQRSFQALFARLPVQAFIAAAEERDFLTPADLQQLPVPAGLIWGLADRFLPSGSLEFFQEHLPGAPTLLLRGCGHLPQRERPLRVAHFVRRFARTLSSV